MIGPEYVLNWFQEQRLRFIEIHAFWHGRVNCSDIIRLFQITRNQALKDVQQYMNMAPGNLDYQGREHAYMVTPEFKNILTRGHINEWLAIDNDVCEYIQKPRLNVKPIVARPLIQAIKANSGIEAVYRSMQHPRGTRRLLYPHTMVYTGFRWHVRAWCCLRNDFRDFNLSRFVRAKGIAEPAPAESAPCEDLHWDLAADIVLIANPELSDDERLLVEAEYEMKRGMLIIETRAALVMYTLQAYQAEPKTHSDGFKPRLVLANLEQLEPFMW